MEILYSQRFDKEKLPYVEKKLFDQRIKELQSCKNLGEIKYGRPHPLKVKYAGMFGLRLGKLSRLILVPILLDPEYINRGGKSMKHYVIGIKIFYSPNHYRNYFGKPRDIFCFGLFLYNKKAIDNRPPMYDQSEPTI